MALKKRRQTRARAATPRRGQPRAGATLSLRRRLQRALPWALASVALLTLMAGVIWLPRAMEAWPVEQVSVRGVEDERRQQQVRAVLSGVVRGENFFSVPLARLHEELASLSWVSEARVRRSWPDRVELEVRERVPVAVWNGEVLVSGGGTPFAALDKYRTEGLPQLSGPERRLDEVMEYYHGMSRILRGSGMAIQSLSVDARLTARVELREGPVLVVDRDGFAGKLRRFMTLHEQVLERESRRPVRVDLRYADGMAVTWEDPGEPEDDERA